MSEIPDKGDQGPKTWKLALADWGALDAPWNQDLPFALWVVGEQALLFHWLDAAVNQGTEKVVLYAADRPMEIRQSITDASLWPIEIEVQSVPSLEGVEADDTIDRLPDEKPLEKAPTDGWELLIHWQALERQWLQNFAEETARFGDYVAVGKYCEISPDVEFVKPYWIGDFVSIGPGCRIGPNVVIENGCLVAGKNLLADAHLGRNTYLGPETELVNAVMQQNELISIKNRARIKGLEAMIASNISPDKNARAVKPSLKDRWLAWRLYLRWRKYGYHSETDFTDGRGQQWPLLQDTRLEARVPWLKLVMKGKLPLFGITPRPASATQALNAEWQSILLNAQPGAFSYADVMDAHEIGSEEEALHCVYQATANPAYCRQLFNNWIEQLK